MTRPIALILMMLLLGPMGPLETRAQTPATGSPEDLRLAQALLCESIESFKPVNRSVVFPVSQGTVMCFTDFDVVAHETEIFHLWIKRDTLVYRKRLIL